jgi:Ni/Co efflux regulator RcnB
MSNSFYIRCAAALVIGSLAATGALADKPEWAGKGKGHDRGGHDERNDRGDDRRGDDRRGDDRERGGDARRHHYFGDQQRAVVREYYGDVGRSGRCPPGLAKKNNGCMPPGQAKKWRLGQPLPREVVYYQVPQDLAVRLGPAPRGHRYVRVAADILLIAFGTGIVVDALQDMGR